MTAGLQVFNSSGGLVLDVTSQSVRVLQMWYLNPNQSGATGSFTDARLNAGNVFWVYQSNGGTDFPQGNPAISVSGNTLSWDFTNSARSPAHIGPGSSYYTGILTIGVYQ